MDNICIVSIDQDQVYAIKFHGNPVNILPLKNSKEEKSKIECWDDQKKIREKAKKLNLPVMKFWLKKKTIDSIRYLSDAG